MNQQNEFEIFYQEKLTTLIDDLKIKSNQSGWGMVIVLVCCMLAFLILFTDSLLLERKYIYFWFFILLSFGCYLIYKFSKKENVYNDEYKAAVIRKIIKHTAPQIDYKPGTFVAEPDYIKSGLFRQYHDVYSGSDGMEGILKNHFQCSEIHTSIEQVHGHPQTIFRGLFFVININEQFNASTYAFATNQIPAISSETGYYEQRPLPALVQVNFNDPDFNEYFSVHTTDIHQALQIFTPQLRHQLVQFQRIFDVNLSLSFVGGNCYIAIPYEENKTDKPLLPSQDFKQEIFEEYKKNQLIINTLKMIDVS